MQANLGEKKKKKKHTQEYYLSDCEGENHER